MGECPRCARGAVVQTAHVDNDMAVDICCYNILCDFGFSGEYIAITLGEALIDFAIGEQLL